MFWAIRAVGYTFYHWRVCNPQWQFDINLHHNFFADNRDPAFVRKLFDKRFLSGTFSWRKALMKTLSSALNTIVCYCLHNSDMSSISLSILHTAGSLEALFVLVYEKKRYFFKILFLHLRLILLGKILYTPFKLTEKCWPLVYINGSFSLTYLLAMCYSARGIADFLLGHSVH